MAIRKNPTVAAIKIRSNIRRSVSVEVVSQLNQEEVIALRGILIAN